MVRTTTRPLINIFCASLPEIPEKDLLRLCLPLEKKITPRLGPEQIAHLNNFALEGLALRARFSRAMARLLALENLPDKLVLGGTLPGKTVCHGWQISFSHAGKAVFCALASAKECTALGIDAEAHPMTFNAPDTPGLWPLREAAFKAIALPLLNNDSLWQNISLQFASGMRSGQLTYRGQDYFWRMLAIRAHWLGLVYKAAKKAQIKIHWLKQLPTSATRIS